MNQANVGSLPGLELTTQLPTLPQQLRSINAPARTAINPKNLFHHPRSQVSATRTGPVPTAAISPLLSPISLSSLPPLAMIPDQSLPLNPTSSPLAPAIVSELSLAITPTSSLSYPPAITHSLLPLTPTLSLSSSLAIDPFSSLAMASPIMAVTDSSSVLTSSPSPRSRITDPSIPLTSSPFTQSVVADPSISLSPTKSASLSSTVIQRRRDGFSTGKYHSSALQPFSPHRKFSSPQEGALKAFPTTQPSPVVDELAGLPNPSLVTERSFPRSRNQWSQAPSPVIQRFVASEDVASEDVASENNSGSGMDRARTTESVAEFRSESLPTFSSLLTLASSTLGEFIYYGDDIARTQIPAVPDRRIAEPILTSTGWLNIPLDDEPVTFAAEFVSQLSISNPTVQTSQPVDLRFEALSQAGAISSSTAIVSNDASTQSGDWQFNRAFQRLNNGSTISYPVERFNTDAQTQGVDRYSIGKTNSAESRFNTDAQTQGADRLSQRLIQPVARTSSANLLTKLLNVGRAPILSNFQEDNYSVGTDFTGQVLGSEDISTKPTSIEERLITWKPLIQLDTTSPAELSNVHVPQAEDLQTQQFDQELNNFPATSLEALPPAETQSQFGARLTQLPSQKPSQSQSNPSTALSNSISRNNPDRSSLVLPSGHINSAPIDSALIDSAGVSKLRMIRSPSPPSVGEISTQNLSELGDLKPFSHTRTGNNVEARLAALTPQASTTTIATSRSSVTSAPTISLPVAELQAFHLDKTDSSESLPEQTVIPPYQRMNPRSPLISVVLNPRMIPPPSPPKLEGSRTQSPPELGDLGGNAGARSTTFIPRFSNAPSISNPDATIPDLATDQSPFTNPVNPELELLVAARLTTPQRFLELEESPLELVDGSTASADRSTLQPGTSFLGLPPSPLPPPPTLASSNSAAPPLTPQPDRAPTQSKQPPTFPKPMPVVAPPRPALSLNDYLNRRRRGQR